MGSRPYQTTAKPLTRPDTSVRAYLDLCGIWLTESETVFNERIASRLGNDHARQLKRALVHHHGGHVGAAYELLYRDLETTRLTASLTMPHLRKWLSVWATLHLPEGDLIDLGCGAGLATCFYALARPDTSVVGIDRSPAAIERARELAQMLGLDNLTFRCGDVLDHTDGLGSFAVVVSTLLLHEVEPHQFWRPHGGFSTLRVLPDLLNGTSSSRLADRAATLLDPGGRYVSMERLPGNPEIAAWIGALAKSGLGGDLGQSDYVTFRPFAGRERVPVIVSGPDVGRVDADAYTAWAIRHPLPADMGPDTFVAEYRFRQAAPFEVVAGWEADWADPP